jgi:signal peptidase II
VQLKKVLPWFAVAAAIIAADRVTKLLALEAFAPGERLQVTGFFNLVLVFNKGAAFSFLAGASGWQTPVFATISTVAAVVISVLIVRHSGNRMLCAALALMLGGALGNLWDRLEWGHVVDFLDFHHRFLEPLFREGHFPAFNVADSAITVGATLLILESFLHRDTER